MLLELENIEQPYSGKYTERVYDIESCWNSPYWSWIKFVEDDALWVGEFRGAFKGAVFSTKLQIVVVLTSDYLYVLDLTTKELIDHERMPPYSEVTCTPLEDILLTDGYEVFVFRGRDIGSLEAIAFPAQPDNLHFGGYEGSTLVMVGEEFLNWNHSLRLLMDCVTFEVSEE